VRRHHPALADTVARVATVRIRNQATIGGNIVHADPAQDPPPILIALDAVAVIAGPNNSRREARLDGFFTDYFSVALDPGELIVGIRVPHLEESTHATYQKFLPRTADDYATVGVAAVAGLDGEGRIATARVVLGAVGPTPIRATSVESALLGRRPTRRVLMEAAQLVGDEIHPIADARGGPSYKREMAKVWTERALTEVMA
jgi:carbon-monoxide dehydrogenase medium subunit